MGEYAYLLLENRLPVLGECVVCGKECKKNNMRKTCSPGCRKEHKTKYHCEDAILTSKIFIFSELPPTDFDA